MSFPNVAPVVHQSRLKLLRAGKYAQNCVCCVPRPLSVPPSARPPSSALGKNTQYDTATESRLLHSSPALERMHGPFARAHVRTFGWMPLLGSASLYMYHHLASAYTASQYASNKKKKKYAFHAGTQRQRRSQHQAYIPLSSCMHAETQTVQTPRQDDAPRGSSLRALNLPSPSIWPYTIPRPNSKQILDPEAPFRSQFKEVPPDERGHRARDQTIRIPASSSFLTPGHQNKVFLAAYSQTGSQKLP